MQQPNVYCYKIVEQKVGHFFSFLQVIKSWFDFFSLLFAV